MQASPFIVRSLAGIVALALSLAGCAAPRDIGRKAPSPLLFASNEAASTLGPAARRAAPAFVTVTLIDPPDAGRSAMRRPADTGIVHSASGWIADGRGYIVTAAHIARGTGYAAVVRDLEGQAYPARIVAVAADRELALLQTETPMDGAPAIFAPTHELRPGDPVFAIGAPDGRPGVVTAGQVMDPVFDQTIRYGRYRVRRAIRLAMTIAPGNSGGPVFDRRGRLVGMIAGFLMAPDGTGLGVGFAIPAGDIREWLAQTISY